MSAFRIIILFCKEDLAPVGHCFTDVIKDELTRVMIFLSTFFAGLIQTWRKLRSIDKDESHRALPFFRSSQCVHSFA